MRDTINQMLRQRPDEVCSFDHAKKTLTALALRIGEAAKIQQTQKR